MTWRLVILALGLALLAATPAAAGPAAVGAIAGFTGLSVGAVGVGLRLAAGLALSALQARLMAQKMRAAQSGIRTQVAMHGGTQPQALILGRTATAGSFLCPHMSHTTSARSENANRTQVICLADAPIDGVEAVWVDGKKHLLSDLSVVDPDGYGNSPNPATHPTYANRFWLKTYDGRQTVADSLLVSLYGSRTTRPWLSTHVGTGLAYAIATFYADPDIYQSEPQLLFEVRGMRLYDWRLDSTAGGSGPQRWNSPATWAYTENPVVIIYNILRGIPLPDGSFWGYGVGAADLPQSYWTAAANTCDEIVAIIGAARYRAGCEVRMATPDHGGDHPPDIVDMFAAACDADLVEIAGRWLINIGPPPPAVAILTDDDLIEAGSDEFEPFPDVQERHNAVRARFVSARQSWQSKEAPARYDAAGAAEDGRVLLGDLTLNAVFSDNQTQRLMKAWLADARRFRRHVITIDAQFDRVEPTECISWTSERHGYVAKRFYVWAKSVDPLTRAVTLTIRERDPADYDWSAGDALAVSDPSETAIIHTGTPVPGFAVAPLTVGDIGGQAQRAGITISWSGAISNQAVAWEIRVQGSGAEVADGSTHDVSRGRIRITTGILPGVTYEVRVRGLRPRTAWSAWAPVTAPIVRLKQIDFAGGRPGNLITASDFKSGLRDILPVAVGTVGAQTVVEIRPPGQSFAGAAHPTMMMFQNGTARNGTVEFEDMRFVARTKSGAGDQRHVPVAPGDWIDASVAASTSRCDGRLYINFRDEAGTFLSAASVEIAANVPSSSSNPDVWPRYAVPPTEVPAGAAYAQLAVRKYGTISGPNSYLFIHKPMMAITHAGATEATAFVPDGATLTDGDQVIDGTLKVAALDTASFSASGLAIFGGAVQSDNFVTGVSGWRIAKTGAMELSQLVVRNSIQVGAVSDLQAIIGLGQVALTTAFTEVFNHIKTVPVDKATMHSAFLTARAPAAGNAVDVLFEERYRETNGNWSGWTTVHAVTVTATAWDIYRKPGGVVPIGVDRINSRIRAKIQTSSATTAVDNGGTGITYQSIMV